MHGTATFAGMFRRVYAEKDAVGYPLAQRVLNRLKNAAFIEIDSYKDIFYRKRQAFSLQKRSPAIILAVNRDGLISKGSENCDGFGNENFYSHTSVINCPYDCEYCYLAAKYPCGHIVIFVNYQESFGVVGDIIQEAPSYFCISYDTDLLALEGMTGIVRSWLGFAAKKERLTIEIRSKSANFNAIEDIEPEPNVILAWTISPDVVCEKFERGAPPLSARLHSARSAIERGWKTRICFDPTLYFDGWRQAYSNCVKQTFESLSSKDVQEISVGVFRAPPGAFGKMSSERMAFRALDRVRAETGSYNQEGEMISFMKAKLLEYAREDKIRIFTK
ncbi:MAG: radical SAM protein [Clostridiales bacterium]|jgi:spore photoproduct lyase|nr:radical SAM protein [Clostridiales bacterium]